MIERLIPVLPGPEHYRGRVVPLAEPSASREGSRLAGTTHPVAGDGLNCERRHPVSVCRFRGCGWPSSDLFTPFCPLPTGSIQSFFSRVGDARQLVSTLFPKGTDLRPCPAVGLPVGADREGVLTSTTRTDVHMSIILPCLSSALLESGNWPCKIAASQDLS